MKTTDLPTYGVFLLTLSLLIIASRYELAAQRLSRDLNVDLLINQAGYLPHAHKACVVKGKIDQTFEVIDPKTQNVVYTGSLEYRPGDLGDFSVGDYG